MALILPPPTAAYDLRDQVEIRRLLSQALTARDASLLQMQQALATGGGGLEARMATVEATLSIVVAALIANGTLISNVSADFSQANNSGLLALISIGGF